MRKLEFLIPESVYTEAQRIAEEEGFATPDELAQALLTDRATSPAPDGLLTEADRNEIRARWQDVIDGAPSYSLNDARLAVDQVRRRWPTA